MIESFSTPSQCVGVMMVTMGMVIIGVFLFEKGVANQSDRQRIFTPSSSLSWSWLSGTRRKTREREWRAALETCLVQIAMAVEMLKEVERSDTHGRWHSYRWLHNPRRSTLQAVACNGGGRD